MSINITAGLCSLTILVLAFSALAQAPDSKPPGSDSNTSDPAEQVSISQRAAQDLTDRVNGLYLALTDSREDIRQLKARLVKTTDPLEKAGLEGELLLKSERVGKYRASLEQLVVGGIDLTSLSAPSAEKPTLQEEMQQILLPLLAGLRDLTSKPRRIEALRTEIAIAEEQLDVLARARSAIARFDSLELLPDARTALDAIIDDWNARTREINQNLDLSRIRLDNLVSEQTSWTEALSDTYREFVRDRGKTLLMAAVAGVLVWLLLKSIYTLYEWAASRRRTQSSRARLRLAQFTFGGVTVLMVVFSMVAVFYFRSDILLFTLSLVLIAFLLVTLRQLVPVFLKEARMLLNIGPVREGERIVYEGIAYEVASINVHCLLKNPDLRGIRRIPIGTIANMISRSSAGPEEQWFPTSTGDHVLLSNGNVGEVLYQSIDFVKLNVIGNLLTIPTAEFPTMGVHNLTREGFGVQVSFGVDYGLQKICLTQIPAALRVGVQESLEQIGVQKQLRELSVDFQEAAESSLNYRIFARFDGEIASQYRALQRLINGACVRVCVEHDWTIPFPQLTLHRAAN